MRGTSSTELEHFGNKLLNILAETQWLGGTFFIWLIVALLKCCFADRRRIPSVAMGCAMVLWQNRAALVEHNIGNSEVLIRVWMLVGSLLYSRRAVRIQNVDTGPENRRATQHNKRNMSYRCDVARRVKAQQCGRFSVETYS